MLRLTTRFRWAHSWPFAVATHLSKYSGNNNYGMWQVSTSPGALSGVWGVDEVLTVLRIQRYRTPFRDRFFAFMSFCAEEVQLAGWSGTEQCSRNFT